MCQPAWSTIRTAWALGAMAARRSPQGAGSSPRYCNRAVSDPRPCPSASGRRHTEKYRLRRCADRGERYGAGATLSPAARNLCFSGRCAPRPGTKSLCFRTPSPVSCATSSRRCVGKFTPFKSLDRALSLSMVTWSGRQFAVAHGAQLSAERLLGYGDAKFLEKSIAPDRSAASAPRRESPGSEPLSIICATTRRWASLSFGGWPGDLPSSSPSGPRALNRSTQSRMIWKPGTPPIFAASVRVAPS